VLERYAASARARAPASSAGASDANGFMREAIERMRVEILGTNDPDALVAFLDDCVRDVDELVARAEAADRAGEPTVVGRMAHTLKSNGALIGAHRLVELAKRLEPEVEGLAEAERYARVAELRAALTDHQRALDRERASWARK
jgi:HPt (histidine-containing phosphotransfer) domain-containing protein